LIISAQRQTQCGHSQYVAGSPGAQIINIGGNAAKARPGDFPWQLAIEEFVTPLNPFLPGSYEIVCGASLISEHWAVTAAHCVQNNAE